MVVPSETKPSRDENVTAKQIKQAATSYLSANVALPATLPPIDMFTNQPERVDVLCDEISKREML